MRAAVGDIEQVFRAKRTLENLQNASPYCRSKIFGFLLIQVKRGSVVHSRELPQESQEAVAILM